MGVLCLGLKLGSQPVLIGFTLLQRLLQIVCLQATVDCISSRATDQHGPARRSPEGWIQMGVGRMQETCNAINPTSVSLPASCACVANSLSSKKACVEARVALRLSKDLSLADKTRLKSCTCLRSL